MSHELSIEEIEEIQHKMPAHIPDTSIDGTDVLPGGLEPPAHGLGNHCSIHLSYGSRCIANIRELLKTI